MEAAIDWILESAMDAMLIVDRKGQIARANGPAEAMFGYQAGALAGLLIEALLPERFRHAHVADRSAYVDKPRARSMGSGMALYGRRVDGTEFPVEVSLSPLKGSHDGLVMATVYDITRRKRAETALQESEERMRAIFDTAVDAIVTIDEAGHIDRCNRAAERLFGYVQAELAGRNISCLMPEPYRSAHDGYLARYRNTGEKRIIGTGREVLGQRKDGSTFPMDLAVAEMRLGERRMFTGVVRDISARRQAEDALHQSQDELRRLSAYQEQVKEDERKRIAQEIHDELGALLTGIKAHVSVSLERATRAGQPEDPLLAEALGLTESAIKTVRKVITDLRPSVLDQLGVWVALEWYAGQVAERTGLDCQCEISPEVHALELGPERSTAVFRVVQEALTNVARHAHAGVAVVRAVCDADSVTVSVTDNGCGIDTERLLNRESWGLLGMYERGRHFNGELRITGTPGQGTAVVLRLPLAFQHD
jgi:PAS domain S-box-containing protein